MSSVPAIKVQTCKGCGLFLYSPQLRERCACGRVHRPPQAAEANDLFEASFYGSRAILTPSGRKLLARRNDLIRRAADLSALR